MANNAYQRPYRQGPPPQQQYYNDHYDQRQQNNPRANQVYDQRNQGHDGYYNEHYNEQGYQSHDNGYEQYDQWDNRQYQDPQYDNRSNPPPPRQHEPALRQQRSYQYDDRYRGNGQARPPPPVQSSQGPAPMRAGQGRPPPQTGRYDNMPRGDANYNFGGQDNRLPRVRDRDRILQTQPESPKTSSWDNPFPTFPSKKKQAETTRPDSKSERRGEDENGTPDQDSQRPSTSAGSQPPRAEFPSELPRPHTSQSQRNFEPLRSPTNIPPMPLRKEVPMQRPHTSHSQRNPEPLNSPMHPPDLPRQQTLQDPRLQPNFHQEQYSANTGPRPVPRRAVTGPAPQQNFSGYQASNEPYDLDRDHEESRYDGPNSQRYPDQHYHDDTAPSTYGDEQGYHDTSTQQRNTSGRQPYGGVTGGHRRRSSDQSYRRDQSGGFQGYDQDSYRGVPLSKKISPDHPNFDVLPDGLTEKTEDHLNSMSQQGRAYNKPTYQTHTSNDLSRLQRRSMETGNNVASPLAQFSFNLDKEGPRPQSRNTPQTPTYHDRPYEAQNYPNSQQQSSAMTERPMQQPQRSGSRAQELPANNPNTFAPNRPPIGNLPIRPGLTQPPGPNVNRDRDHHAYEAGQANYDSAFVNNDNGHRPGMPPSQMSSQSDPSRRGYDQRLQPRPGFATPQPAPPHAGNSNAGRSGTMTEYGSRSSSDSYQRNGFQNPDSLPAHPAPFRPGLMQPTPPAPRPTPPPQQPQAQPQYQSQPQPQVHRRGPSDPKPSTASEPPVTIQELNALQKEYKNNPNNYALGLKFAKRLVEAAKVLASENGRADAKTTAKNRERYIIDAHKIVKRLCSAGYPEAMFYLADCHGQGLLGLESDPKEAFSLYQSAAKLGHPQAAYRVAVCCELGSEEGGGTRRDPLKAVQWYKRAATLGDTPAMYKMGMIQLKGLLGQPKTPREAISWLKRAAEQADAENPHALHELGLLYESAQPSDIVLKDEKYALQLFEQAADLGYKYSQFRLGSAYEYGLLGLPIDPRMSIAYYSRAAKQGEHQSEFALSGWYLTGSGPSAPGEAPLLQQSDTEAYLWARKAASSGLAKAEYAMGYYTEVGIGVTSNIEEAKRWYYRAAAQNHPKARERLEDLKKGGQRMQKTRVSRSNVGKHNEGECAVM